VDKGGQKKWTEVDRSGQKQKWDRRVAAKLRLIISMESDGGGAN
jgi:hypothetical protein